MHSLLITFFPADIRFCSCSLRFRLFQILGRYGHRHNMDADLSSGREDVHDGGVWHPGVFF